MQKVAQTLPLRVRSHRLSLLVIALTLAVLAAMITLTTLQVRERIRSQIARRDGEVLHAVAVAVMQQNEELEEPGNSLDNPGDQLNLVLVISRLKEVMGVRLFGPDGRFTNAFPENVRDGALNAADVAALRGLKPVSHFHAAMPPSALFYLD